MRWPHTNSGLAIRARRLRSRFGISAPRLTVRTQLPWHWRVGGIIVVAAASLALAGWIYDAGRSIAGFKNAAMETLQERADGQEEELKQLRSEAVAADARLQIARAALEQFKKHTAQLEEENVRLKEELAVFENMVQGRGGEGSLAISRLRIEPTVDGAYGYSMLVTRQQSKKDGEFRGQLQFLLNIQQASGNAMITLPEAGDPEATRYQVAFRNFHRLAGRFSIPDGAQLISVEARLIQDGSVKTTQRITL